MTDVFSPTMPDGTPRVFIGVHRRPPITGHAALVVGDGFPQCGRYYTREEHRAAWDRGDFDVAMYRDPPLDEPCHAYAKDGLTNA